MKKTFNSLLSLFLILSACASGETKDSTEEGSDQITTFPYKTAEFQMEVLKNWEIEDSFTSEYPKGLRVAFRNDVKDSIFTANVTVLVEENTGNDTSYDFAQRKLADHKDTLLNYELLEQENITLIVSGAKSTTVRSTFKGKNGTSSPSLEFMQVTLAEGEKAWTVTATYRPSEEEFLIEQMQEMLGSFTLR